MMITEYNFLWLHEAEEERFAQELEHRRVVEERLAQQVTPETVSTRLVRWLRRVSAAGGTM
ncbi:hypothetical protein [Herbiconiux sp.]|uniref:hypothetical protein n=1 Tax=Herbiconiux sp. TaxID=1871186 RepID=UPI0025C1228E|nr:hypothetical protein [Herbiconiux sp.]